MLDIIILILGENGQSVTVKDEHWITGGGGNGAGCVDRTNGTSGTSWRGGYAGNGKNGDYWAKGPQVAGGLIVVRARTAKGTLTSIRK